MLYDLKNKGILVLDNFNDVFRYETSLINLLKTILESSESRKLTDVKNKLTKYFRIIINFIC